MTTLAEMLEHDIGMLTTVIIGNSTTFFYDNKMITPRGYQRKYTLGDEKQPLRPHQRLKEENEPWAMNQETGAARNDFATDPNANRIKPSLTIRPQSKPKNRHLKWQQQLLQW